MTKPATSLATVLVIRDSTVPGRRTVRCTSCSRAGVKRTGLACIWASPAVSHTAATMMNSQPILGIVLASLMAFFTGTGGGGLRPMLLSPRVAMPARLRNLQRSAQQS